MEPHDTIGGARGPDPAPADLQEQLDRRTRELADALEHQAATSEVLNIISRSPTAVQPVFDAIVSSAARLCGAALSNVQLYDGNQLHVMATHNYTPEALDQFRKLYPMQPDRSQLAGRAILARTAIHVQDVLADPEYSHDFAVAGGLRAMLSVPMLREGRSVGVITVAKHEPAPFAERQVELLKTFADQAVIAIENVRLFEEVRRWTEELSESLQQQTATADVLKVISRSTFDLPKVLDTLLDAAAHMGEADIGTIRYREGEKYLLAATFGCTPEWKADFERYSTKPDRGAVYGRTMLEGRTVHIPDVLADPEFNRFEAQKLMGFRAALGVPLMRQGDAIGALILFRFEPQSFTPQQIKMVDTFADQAVIAIENARLLGELRESLQQQTATADVLKVISRSTFDLQAVLHTLVESAARLCEADKATITRQIGGVFYRAEAYGFSSEFMEYVKDIPVDPERRTASGRALLEGHVVHISDVMTDPDYTWTEAQKLGDFRTILAVPMLREGVPIGVLALTRSEVRPFTDKQIELVSTFADQAAIAIENARLFESVQERTRELAQSLEDLRTAQDRLVQTEKLASLGQLTAGIAHEIKNPLNFINNFSSVSAELIGELQETLRDLPLDDRRRAETNELANLLRGNLDKIVQHGKRADSIVRNMLLHSRAGSGEHRPVDINAIVEESLNLAYHGARAEGTGFNITLERSFDLAAGEVDLFPQEITRVLLNLISNGFYATMKRKEQENCEAYEPTLIAATKNLGDKVEIRVRDNGTGIPPEVKDKMFNPFFTTKPVGEGTGLGLSISYDIIVKQHAGTVEVETEPGAFTEFRIVLPRRAASLAGSGGRA